MDIDHSKIYVTKQIEAKVECYDRTYDLIATTGLDILGKMHENHKVIQTWTDWTGGKTPEPGVTLWWDTYETPPEQMYPPQVPS